MISPRIGALGFAFIILLGISSTRAAQRFGFNADWKLLVGDPHAAVDPAFDDSAWKSCTLPRAFNEDSAFAVAIDQLPTGVAWYRKTFIAPANSNGRKVFVEFEGIRHGGEFFLNGKSIGRSDNGVTAFGFDLSDALLPAPQKNVLAARIDSSWNYHEAATNSTFQWNDRNFYANYGGINKNVYLHVTDWLHQTLPLFSSLGTTGVYVYASDIDIPNRRANITAQSQVRNDHSTAKTFTYHVEVADVDGKVIKSFESAGVNIKAGETKAVSASAVVDGLHFWSWGYGYLCTVTTTLVVNAEPVDVVQTRTGFRKTSFEHGYLTLNDRPIQVHGYAQRTTNEWPALGNCVPAWVSDFSNGLLVQGNGNLVRWMHVTPWKQDVESCDRVGLMQAMPAGDSERDVTGRRWEQRVEVMCDAIIYNRNNPSIVFYECGNKGISEDHMRQMKAVRDEYDPHGGRAIGAREMLDHNTAAEYGGEMLYINKSAGKPLWAMEYSRDEGARKYWDELTPPYHSVPLTNRFRKPGPGETHAELPPAYEYNRNQDSFAIEDVARWYDYWRERPGTGARVSGGGVNIIFSDSNTHFRGAQNYRCSGEVDAVRLPKDGYFANQVMWDGWVDVEHARAHILGHWNYESGVVKDVSVVSSATKVQLFLNDRSVGFGERSNQFLFTFKSVTWQPGVLKAVGYDANGKQISADVLHTAGEAVALRLSPHISSCGLLADGTDLALVDVEVVDVDSNRCPTALNTIHFDLTGPAEWRGGIALDDDRPDNYILSRDLPVQCGINRVIIHTRPQAGMIALAASSEGLKPASIQLQSISPGGDALPPPPVSLDRGPTPDSPSIHPTRDPITIARASAGSNSDDAMLSLDDDETTGWQNDGELATAWIDYTFDRDAIPTEVSLKLSGWRTTRYPLRITIDGHEVFAGLTSPGLGYVTLPLRPMHGKIARIQLTAAPAADRDAFDLVEVTGNSQPDSTSTSRPGIRGSTTRHSTTQPPTTRRTSGKLNIIEAEFYQARTAE